MPELHLLTGAYALDALNDVERANFERHLRSCGSCAAEVIEFQEATASLADRVATDPPEHMRAKVMAEVARTRQVAPAGRVKMHRPSLRRMLATAAAAVVLAGSAGLGGVAYRGHEAAKDTKVQAQAEAARASELARVLTDPSGIDVVKTPSVGGVTKVVAAQGKAVLAANQLPTLPSGKAYQVWVINRSAKISSAGALALDAGSGQTLVNGVAKGDTVAITVEPAGLSKQPTTEPIVMIPVA